jgi:hypothetical protein
MRAAAFSQLHGENDAAGNFAAAHFFDHGVYLV